MKSGADYISLSDFLFGGKSAVTSFANRPQNLFGEGVVPLNQSPLWRNSKGVVSRSLQIFGIRVGAEEFIASAERCFAEAADLNDYWLRLNRSFRNKLDQSISTAQTLSHLVWTLSIPFEDAPIAAEACSAEDDEYLAQTISLVLSRESIVHDKSSKNFITGCVGNLNFSISFKVEKNHLKIPMVEIKSITYLGRFDSDIDQDDEFVLTEILNTKIEYDLVPYAVNDTNVQASLLYSFPLGKIDQPSMLPRWLALFKHMMSKSQKTLDTLKLFNVFLPHRSEVGQPPNAKFNLPNSEEIYPRDSRQERDLFCEINSDSVHLIEHLDGYGYYLPWGEDRCPVFCLGNRLVMMVPFKIGQPELLYSTILELNYGLDIQSKTATMEISGGSWCLALDSDSVEGKSEAWNLVFQSYVPISDVETARWVIESLRRWLRQIANKVDNSLYRSYLKSWRSAVDRSFEDLHTLYWGRVRIDPRRLSSDDQQSWEQERRDEEVRRRRRAILIFQSKASIVAQDRRTASKQLLDAESLSSGSDVRKIRAFCELLAGNAKAASTILKPFEKYGDVAEIVMASVAFHIDGQTEYADRCLRRATQRLI